MLLGWLKPIIVKKKGVTNCHLDFSLGLFIYVGEEFKMLWKHSTVKNQIIYVLLLLSIISACNNSTDNTAETSNETLKIIFHLTAQDQHLSCSQAFSLPESSNRFYIKDFRLYLHEVELLSTNG